MLNYKLRIILSVRKTREKQPKLINDLIISRIPSESPSEMKIVRIPESSRELMMSKVIRKSWRNLMARTRTKLALMKPPRISHHGITYSMLTQQ
jgi:hypothetical protein